MNISVEFSDKIPHASSDRSLEAENACPSKGRQKEREIEHIFASRCRARSRNGMDLGNGRAAHG
jgi:hypothetical protein